MVSVINQIRIGADCALVCQKSFEDILRLKENGAEPGDLMTVATNITVNVIAYLSIYAATAPLEDIADRFRELIIDMTPRAIEEMREAEIENGNLKP